MAALPLSFDTPQTADLQEVALTGTVPSGVTALNPLYVTIQLDVQTSSTDTTVVRSVYKTIGYTSAQTVTASVFIPIVPQIATGNVVVVSSVTTDPSGSVFTGAIPKL